MTTIYYLLFYFIVYSIAGWFMESVFRSITEKKIINTGFMHGPYCPIYGFGAVIMITLLSRFKENITLLFIVNFIILSLWEYIVGAGLEKIFNTKYWDYSKYKINIKGRVCLINSIYWGVLGVVFTLFIHPTIENLVLKMPVNLIIYLDIIILVTFITDAIITGIRTIRINKKIIELKELSEKIFDKIEKIKINTQNKIINKKQEIKQKENDLETLEMRHNKIKIALYKQLTRMKKAFPTMQSDIINKFLSEKIDINELKEKIKNIKKLNKKIDK